MAIKELIATTVSSRESDNNEEMKDGLRVVKSDRSTSEGGGRDTLKKVDGDFPTRHKKRQPR